MSELQQHIQDSTLIYRTVGFARQGVMPHASVVERALEKLAALAKSGVFQPHQNLSETERVLDQLRTRLLPDSAACTKSMDEIDEFRLPLNREHRRLAEAEASASERQSAPRPRG
jgi:hypothetical protein